MSEHGRPTKREILRTGTYLHAYCPHCRKDLAEENWVRLLIEVPPAQRGELHLSPRFNVFQKESSVPLEAGVEIRDLRCPGCGDSIVTTDRSCTVCGARAAKLHVSVVHLDLDLYFCMRTGCTWHGLTTEDEQRIELDETPES